MPLSEGLSLGAFCNGRFVIRIDIRKHKRSDCFDYPHISSTSLRGVLDELVGGRDTQHARLQYYLVRGRHSPTEI